MILALINSLVEWEVSNENIVYVHYSTKKCNKFFTVACVQKLTLSILFLYFEKHYMKLLNRCFCKRNNEASFQFLALD